MDVIWSMLLLATSLGTLSYVLGALIYALPIPLKGLKRWAPYLISDGILTVTLSLLFGLIIWGMSEVYKMMGINRDSYVKEILRITENVSTIYIVLTYISTVLKTIFKLKLAGIPIGVIFQGIYLMYSKYRMFVDILTQPVMEIMISSLRAAIYSWAFLYIVSRVSELLAPFMLASGIVLIGVPFRVTRASGAVLMSLAIVTYVVAPLVILVLNAIAQYNPTLAALWNSFLGADLPNVIREVAYVNGKVVDAEGRAVPYALVKFCDLNGVCGFYPTNEKGEFVSAYDLGGVPWPKTKVYVDVLGVEIDKGVIDLRRLGISQSQIVESMQVKNNGLYVEDAGLIIRISNCAYQLGTPKFYTSKDGELYFTFDVTSRYKDCDVVVATSGTFDPNTMGFYVSGKAVNPQLNREMWYGIDVWKLSFRVREGDTVEVIINGKKASFQPPNFGNGIGYLANKLGLHILESLGKYEYNQYDLLLVPFFLTAIPMLHIMIIVMTTYGLASALSEGVKKVSLRMW